MYYSWNAFGDKSIVLQKYKDIIKSVCKKSIKVFTPNIKVKIRIIFLKLII